MSLEIMQVQQPVEAPAAPLTNDFSFVSFGIAIAIMFVVLALTIYIVSRLPGYIARESSRVVHTTRDMVLPKVIPRKKVSLRKRIQVSSRLLFGIKIVASILPFAGLYGVMVTRPPISNDVIIATGLFLLVCSLILIAFQRVMAYYKKVDYSISL